MDWFWLGCFSLFDLLRCMSSSVSCLVAVENNDVTNTGIAFREYMSALDANSRDNGRCPCDVANHNKCMHCVVLRFTLA